MTPERLQACQDVLGYRFGDEQLLVRALTHSSSKTEALPSNERLEFLGDSVLGMLIAEHLFRTYADWDEGDLTKIKSVVVSASTLAQECRRLRLSRFFAVGKGMAKQALFPQSLKANVLEAIIGAVYLDGGIDEARRFVLRILGVVIEAVARDQHGGNWKSILQHHAQKVFNVTPTYRVTREEGPDHLKIFEVIAVIGEQEYGRGTGRSKKEAEQNAAEQTLRFLEVDLDRVV